MRTLIDFIMKYRKVPGTIVRLIRGVDQRFIKVEYDKYFFDGYFLTMVSRASTTGIVISID